MRNSVVPVPMNFVGGMLIHARIKTPTYAKEKRNCFRGSYVAGADLCAEAAE